MKAIATDNAASQALLTDIRQLIGQSRVQFATAVNSALTLLYWHIGRRIRSEVFKGESAEYGEQIVASLSQQLVTDYGRGFSNKNLRHMLRFAEAFPGEEIVYAPNRQLSWTHLRCLIYINDPLKREFYINMCHAERWNTRVLQGRLDSMLFKRTALSGKRWLAKHEQELGEASPLGIILCSGKKQKQIELLELDQTGIHVAEYLTELPPKAVLQQKLHGAIRNSRHRLGEQTEKN
jgi:hypothetical protein